MKFFLTTLALAASFSATLAFQHDIMARDLYADEHFEYRRDLVADAADAFIEARDTFELHRRLGGNGDCRKASKSSGKIHCMKGGRSCSTKGCREEGVSCLCDVGFH